MSASAHTPEWEVYFCDINERPACVSVDLGFENLAPIPEKHTVFEVVVALQQPDADGFPADEAEWEQLEAIEEALVTAFQDSLQAVFVGKLLHDGKRNFYFYSAQEALPEVLASNVMQAYPDYTYATNTQRDSDWGLYLDFLFPEPADMQSIKNSRVLQMMQEQGDEAHIPRPVTHKVSFASETDRDSFGKQVVGEGYTLMGQGMEQNADAMPYWLIISHVMPLNEDSVHETTLYLWQLAETHQGSYDGWEAQVLREND
jgi:uncharacterized protein (TIGR01619 family)